MPALENIVLLHNRDIIIVVFAALKPRVRSYCLFRRDVTTRYVDTYIRAFEVPPTSCYRPDFEWLRMSHDGAGVTSVY